MGLRTAAAAAVPNGSNVILALMGIFLGLGIVAVGMHIYAKYFADQNKNQNSNSKRQPQSNSEPVVDRCSSWASATAPDDEDAYHLMRSPRRRRPQTPRSPLFKAPPSNINVSSSTNFGGGTPYMTSINGAVGTATPTESTPLASPVV